MYGQEIAWTEGRKKPLETLQANSVAKDLSKIF